MGPQEEDLARGSKESSVRRRPADVGQKGGGRAQKGGIGKVFFKKGGRLAVERKMVGGGEWQGRCWIDG